MYSLIIAAALVVMSASNAAHAARTSMVAPRDVPRGWAPADSADSLWRQGRNAISDEDWRAAQRLFARIHDRYPKSAYAADSYYWEAFALSRLGGTENVRDAVSLLERQIERYASASSVTNGDSKSLLTRLQGALARGGDADAAAEISARAAATVARANADVARSGAAIARAVGGRSRAESVPAGCKSEDDDDRVEALNALLQMGSDDALPILKKVLARRDAVLGGPAAQGRLPRLAEARRRGRRHPHGRPRRTIPTARRASRRCSGCRRCRSDKAIPLLEQILKTSTDEDDAGQGALRALAELRRPRAAGAPRLRVARGPSRITCASSRSSGSASGTRTRTRSSSAICSRRRRAARRRTRFSSHSRRRERSGNDQWLLEQVDEPEELDGAAQAGALLGRAERKHGHGEPRCKLYDKVVGERVQEPDDLRARAARQVARSGGQAHRHREEREGSRARKQALFWLGQSHDPRAVKALQEIINR